MTWQLSTRARGAGGWIPCVPPKYIGSGIRTGAGVWGITLIVAVEESGHLIPQHVTVLIEASLLSSTKHDVYCAGGVDCDNLYPAYSNLVGLHKN